MLLLLLVCRAVVSNAVVVVININVVVVVVVVDAASRCFLSVDGLGLFQVLYGSDEKSQTIANCFYDEDGFRSGLIYDLILLLLCCCLGRLLNEYELWLMRCLSCWLLQQIVGIRLFHDDFFLGEVFHVWRKKCENFFFLLRGSQHKNLLLATRRTFHTCN